MDYSAELTKVLGSNQTLALVFLILANVVLGVMVALKDGKFTLPELAAIFRKVALYGGTYLGLGVTSEAMAGPASVVAETGSLLAFLPFIASSVADTRKMGLPVEKVIGTKMADVIAPFAPPTAVPPFGSGVPAIDELNVIYRDYRAGGHTAAGAEFAVANWKSRYPTFAGIVPPGWPTT